MKTITAAIILLIALSLVIWKISSGDSSTQPEAEVVKSPRKKDSSNETNHTQLSGTTPNHAGNPSGELDPNQQADKSEIIEKIHDASTTYDKAFLPVIKPYLTDADPEIRQTAVDAMIVLGDAAAAPMLREAAISMKTAKDVKIMLEAAEYVELPSADLSNLKRSKKMRSDSSEDPSARKPMGPRGKREERSESGESPKVAPPAPNNPEQQ